ncbi:hypothetical protein BN2476_380015 [Paraburkholderia piptadeniae]|uniref:Uncharacterized protein n=1 Tax=Paraburkholderia piptadeniae TaxID=1701573 RepID=A0A1N7S9M3_9BURK|nr:hypothetical protein BN2476_380015 [Paraburkholderia piptadeniae]
MLRSTNHKRTGVKANGRSPIAALSQRAASDADLPFALTVHTLASGRFHAVSPFHRLLGKRSMRHSPIAFNNPFSRRVA